MDPTYGHLRHEELIAAAAEHRLARTRRRPRTPLALRLYGRVWWASRPRVDTWPAPAELQWGGFTPTGLQ